jgi:hypothetical protein|tara:strand:- start:514 stop:756 length:243 start_codon:yes stop_codon:yes gene_type:complete
MARGKVKGATSFVLVGLADLNHVLKPAAMVMISRKFAENLNLESKKVEAGYDTYSFVNNQVDVVKDMEMSAAEEPIPLDF